MLDTFCSDLDSGTVCEDRLFGLVVLAWIPEEKISSLKRKKRKRKKKKVAEQARKWVLLRHIYSNNQRLKSDNSMGYQKTLRQSQASQILVLALLLSFFLLLLFFLMWMHFYLFIYFWLCWVFVSVRGLSLVVASRGHSSSQCAGLSLSRPLVAEHRLQTCRLSSCGSRAQLLRGIWDLPRPGLEPVSPALAGRFSTTAPPGKPLLLSFMITYKSHFLSAHNFLSYKAVCVHMQERKSGKITESPVQPLTLPSMHYTYFYILFPLDFKRKRH